MSKLDKKATSKGKQVEIAPPKKMKATSKGESAPKGGAASEGEGAATVLPEDKKKTSTSSRGKKADALAKGHTKTIVEKNNAEMKPKPGTPIFIA
jgi:hypothetical protein